MALGYMVKVLPHHFAPNDAIQYYGVTGISLGADLVTLTLTGAASGTNFGATTSVNLMSAGKIEIIHTVTEFPGMGATN